MRGFFSWGVAPKDRPPPAVPHGGGTVLGAAPCSMGTVLGAAPGSMGDGPYPRTYLQFSKNMPSIFFHFYTFWCIIFLNCYTNCDAMCCEEDTHFSAAFKFNFSFRKG